MENKMTHCPKCSKPILNAGQFWGSAQFNIKCPWCQSLIAVSVQQQISAKLKHSEPVPNFNSSASFNNDPAPQDNSVFDEPTFPNQKEQAVEDEFKVVGYIYRQGEKKQPG